MKNNVNHQLTRVAKMKFKPHKEGSVEVYINGTLVGIIAESHKGAFFNRMKAHFLNGTEVERIAKIARRELQNGEE